MFSTTSPFSTFHHSPPPSKKAKKKGTTLLILAIPRIRGTKNEVPPLDALSKLWTKIFIIHEEVILKSQ